MKFEKRGDMSPDEKTQTPEQSEDKSPKTLKKRQEAVLLYMAVLFIVALGLIVLSYFIQQRRTDDTINTLTEQHSEFSIQALQNIEDLQNSNLELKDELEEKEEQIEELQSELESIRQEWADDVKNVEDTLKTDYNELLQQKSAIEELYQARKAIEDGDKDAASQHLASAEIYKDMLDETWLEELESLKSAAAAMR